MVYLNRIYTKSGDLGETSLGDGSRVPKTAPRIQAFGAVDELNATLGVVLAIGNGSSEHSARLLDIQNDLFDLGADLCVPETETPPEYPPLRVTESQVTKLERWIDADTARLQPLNSFILPGGSASAAFLHQARTICRRAEITVLQLAETTTINSQVVIYLNRLSDLFFTMARIANDEGRADVLWTPGAGRQSVSAEPVSTEHRDGISPEGTTRS